MLISNWHGEKAECIQSNVVVVSKLPLMHILMNSHPIVPRIFKLALVHTLRMLLIHKLLIQLSDPSKLFFLFFFLNNSKLILRT